MHLARSRHSTCAASDLPLLSKQLLRAELHGRGAPSAICRLRTPVASPSWSDFQSAPRRAISGLAAANQSHKSMRVLVLALICFVAKRMCVPAPDDLFTLCAPTRISGAVHGTAPTRTSSGRRRRLPPDHRGESGRRSGGFVLRDRLQHRATASAWARRAVSIPL